MKNLVPTNSHFYKMINFLLSLLTKKPEFLDDNTNLSLNFNKELLSLKTR